MCACLSVCVCVCVCVQGDPPPEPDVFQIEMADETLGVEELISLGLLTRPLQ